MQLSGGGTFWMEGRAPPRPRAERAAGMLEEGQEATEAGGVGQSERGRHGAAA